MIKRKLKICNGCGNERPIFKNKMVDDMRMQLCADCARKEHVQLKPTTKQIKKRSDKKVMEDRLYTILRKKYMDEHPNCEINTASCTTVGTEIHHTHYRTGENYLDITTWKTSCRACHNWVHQNPIEARELKLLN